MRGVIKKWGNSAAVRLPAPALKSLHLNIEDQVEICLEDGCIVLKPVPEGQYRLGDLLARITPDNVHPEIDLGTPGY
ncbi:MAG TPA: AbrB/MazE/SpoVT family DNA-binding domain-containing protein [Burkholderiaceae bacterium]|nr:AbrB/MazE/SpoVT family DNA-binding domain-containing protein [Burkholderiaceae bacterium]